MSETREQSYYEIALTNRQVMSIFIVLLVCLLASFVSGVWIGRQGDGVRVQTADVQRIGGERGAGEAPLGEMDFFSGRQAAPGGTPPVESSAGGLAQPAGEPAASEPPGSPDLNAAAPVTASKPDAKPPAPEPKPVAPRPREPRAPATKSDQAPASTSNRPAAAASTEGEFLYIQVFSGLDRSQAQSIVERLRKGGYAAFLSSVEVETRLMHRVRIGPYSERGEAEEVAGKVQREFKLSTWITP